MFTDRIKVQLIAGKGGNGVVTWRREKYIPKGGPTGGDGGNGGNIVLSVNEQLSSLEWYRHRRKLRAENGLQGGPNQRQGRSGKALLLEVPCGTLIKDADTGEILHDMTVPGEELVICSGGKGGRGNHGFRTPTNRAPNQCTPGLEGEVRNLEFELKLIADVGLVGFPNAGKSTLLSIVAEREVKIAPYPFTTLHPNIGFLERDDYTRLYIADIPGIIENAHANRGLGLEFLRHIERTKLLIFVLDASGVDGRTAADDYRVLRNEIELYNPELNHHPYIVVLNKIDAEDSAEQIAAFHRAYTIPSERLFEVSALSGTGMAKLITFLKEKA